MNFSVFAQDGITNPATEGSINIFKAIPAFFSLIVSIGGIAFLLYFILAGIMWITAGGDPKKTETASKQITNAVIGLAILGFGWAIGFFFDKLLRLNILSGGIKIPSWF